VSRSLLLATSIFAGILVPLPVQAQGNQLPQPEAAARVNGQPVPKKSVDRAMKNVRPEDLSRFRTEVLTFLIDNMLIDQYLVQQQKVTLDAKEIEARMTEIKKEIEQGKKSLEAILKELDMTEEEFKAQVVADLRWEKFSLAQSTEANLKTLFDKSPEIFDGSMVRARHILLTPASGDAKLQEAAKAELLAMRKKVEETATAGVAKLPPSADALTREQERCKQTEEAFSGLAREKSTCPSKRDGGDINWFPRVGSMVEPFAAAAFALKPYEMSEPVQSQFGWHLILVTGRKPGQAVKFEQVKDEVREVYCNKLRERLVAKLRETAKIEYMAVKP
jgi:peptidyl-prolyl cis-trans isomerase C